MSDRNTSKDPISRRRFLLWVGNIGLLTITWEAIKGSVRFLQPPIIQPEPMPIIVGAAADFPNDSLTFVAAAIAWVGRDDDGYFAMSAICPHLGCTLRQDESAFACPCHGSRFNHKGDVTHGPATSPMQYLAVTIQSGNLLINPANPVTPDTRLAV